MATVTPAPAAESRPSPIEEAMVFVEEQITIMQDVGNVAVARLVDGSSAMPDLPPIRERIARRPGEPGRLGRFVLGSLGIDTSPDPTAPDPADDRPGHIQSAIARVHRRRAKSIYTSVAGLTNDRARSRYHAAVTGEDRGVQTEQLRGVRADFRSVRRAFRLGPSDTRRGLDGQLISKGYVARPNHMPKAKYGRGPRTAQEMVVPLPDAAGTLRQTPQVAVPEQRPLSRRRRKNSIATVDLRARLRQEANRLRFEASEALTRDEIKQAIANYLQLRMRSAATRMRSRHAVANPERGNGHIISRFLDQRSDAEIAYPGADGADIQLAQRLHLRATRAHRARSAGAINSGFRTQERMLGTVDVINLIGAFASAGYEAWQNRGRSDDGPNGSGPAPLPPTPPYGFGAPGTGS